MTPGHAHPSLAAPPHHVTRLRLFIDLQHGLGNRLRALSSAAVIAQACDRQLVVIWVPDHHCGARMGDLFDHDQPLIETAQAAALMRDSAARVYNYMEIEPGSRHLEPVLADPVGGDVYVRSAYTLVSPLLMPARERTWLWAMRPSRAVRDLLGRGLRGADLAVHVRMATGPAFDHLRHEAPDNWPAHRHRELVAWREKSHISRFIARLDQLETMGERGRIFAAADLPASYAALADRYGSRLHWLPRDLHDRSAPQQQHALADMLLLASAGRFLASSWSSFSDMAQRLARPGRPVELSGRDF